MIVILSLLPCIHLEINLRIKYNETSHLTNEFLAVDKLEMRVKIVNIQYNAAYANLQSSEASSLSIKITFMVC